MSQPGVELQWRSAVHQRAFDRVMKEHLLPLIANLLTSPEWPRRYGKSFAPGRKRIMALVERFLASAVRWQAELTAEDGHFDGDLSTVIAMAGLEPTKDENIYRLALNPILRVVPPALLASLDADDDVSLSVHHFTIDAVWTRADRDSHVEGVWPDSRAKYGATFCGLALAICGSANGGPFKLRVGFRPILRNDADPERQVALALLGLLGDLSHAIDLLRACHLDDAAERLKRYPFVIPPLEFGAPLKRGDKPGLAHILVPGASHIVASTLVGNGCRVALALTRPPGRGASDCAGGRVQLRPPGRGPLSAEDMHKVGGELLETDVRDVSFERILRRRLGMKVIASTSLPDAGPDHAWLMPTVAERGSAPDGPPAFKTRAQLSSADVERKPIDLSPILCLDARTRTAHWWLVNGSASLIALARSENPIYHAERSSCDTRAERVSMALHLRHVVGEAMRYGCEGIIEIVSTLYAVSALDEEA